MRRTSAVANAYAQIIEDWYFLQTSADEHKMVQPSPEDYDFDFNLLRDPQSSPFSSLAILEVSFIVLGKST